MTGVLEEATDIIEDTECGTMIRNVGLIVAAQNVETLRNCYHGILRAFAQHMAHKNVAVLLSQTMENEKAIDIALIDYAVSFVNRGYRI